MPHDLIWGHLKMLGSLPPKNAPKDLAENYLVDRIVENWQIAFPGVKSCPDVIYLDLWPLLWPTVIVIDPTLSAQYTQHPSAPKHESIRTFAYPLTRNLDVFSSEGELWKTWRARLNPGFSARNLASLMSDITDEVATFVDLMKRMAGPENGGGGTWSDMFRMLPYTTRLTFDVIGRVTLGVRLDEQKGKGTGIREALAENVGLLVFDNSPSSILKVWNPMRRYRLWRNNRIMDRFLVPFIERELKWTNEDGLGAQKTVLRLGVKNVKDELGTQAGEAKLDRFFVQIMLAQLKAFLFAGHDTTSTSLCMVFHELRKHPEAAAEMRAEHDRVFGTDVCKAKEKLDANPALVNAVPYTTGVIKETLRLHPNIQSVRQGSRDINFVGLPGYEHLSFPTEGMMIWDGVSGMHFREDLWVRATEFLPERWVASASEEGNPLHPPRNTWRPFSMGPRNCIGQELAMLEMKVTLILMARELDIEEAWGELDRGRRNEQKGCSEPDTWKGERLYFIEWTTPHPKDDMPVRVRLRKRGVA